MPLIFCLPLGHATLPISSATVSWNHLLLITNGAGFIRGKADCADKLVWGIRWGFCEYNINISIFLFFDVHRLIKLFRCCSCRVWAARRSLERPSKGVQMSLSVWHKFCVTEIGIYCRYSMWKELIIINLVPQGTVLEQYHRKLSKKKKHKLFGNNGRKLFCCQNSQNAKVDSSRFH